MDRAKRIEAAIRQAKRNYEGQCVVTFQPHPDGAHIIPRDVRGDLADNIDNIIPLKREIHRLLDELPDRDYEARFAFLINHTLPELKGKVREQIERLKETI